MALRFLFTALKVHVQERIAFNKELASEKDFCPVPPIRISFITFFGYLILTLFGYFRDALRRCGLEKRRQAIETGHEGYVPLYLGFDNFFYNNIFRRFWNCFNSPISSEPGAIFEVMERKSTDHGWNVELTGKKKTCINMASYNYLGFGANSGPCTEEAEDAALYYGIGVGSTRHELGSLSIHRELEALCTRFLQVDDCIVCGMGFATNALNIPALFGEGSLIISDELNHRSLILGSMLSQAEIKVFKHNDMNDLEKILRKSIIEGQNKTHRPWKKILIIVEGIYSMEGTIVNLPEVIRLKKKYKAYLYLDEAHSIGAIGPSGRGVVDFYKCNPRDVDILMGTFTKSFGAAGGYLAGSKALISHLRIHSHSACYANSFSAPVAQQIISAVRMIMEEQPVAGQFSYGSSQFVTSGRQRIQQLRTNAIYFRRQLKKMGFLVYGHDTSPVVPVIISVPAKTYVFPREMFKRGIATCVTFFPATPILGSRVRFCLSSAHTKEMLDQVLSAMDEVGDMLGMKYSLGSPNQYFAISSPEGATDLTPRPSISEYECEDFKKTLKRRRLTGESI
jgi:serine palmitoyltransferase